MSNVLPALRNLPTLAEIEAARRGKPIPKGPTIRQQNDADAKIEVVDEKTFRAKVRNRDKHVCRYCGRKVEYTAKRTLKRGEVHHLHGRRGALKFEDRAALLLCGEHHDEATGKVGGVKLHILGTATFRLDMKRGIEEFTDARKPVEFRRVTA